MDIKYKIKLVEILRLRPADLNVIETISFSDESLNGLWKDDLFLLEKELGNIVNNENIDDKTRLVAASLKTHLLWHSASDAIDEACEKMVSDGIEDSDGFDDFYDEETWENKLYKENQGNPKEREKAFKEGKKMIADSTKEELTKMCCEFIMQKYPQLKDGFDKGIYRIGMMDFHEHLGIKGKEYLLAQDSSNKFYLARQNVPEELNKIIDDFFFCELDYWKEEYKKWLAGRHETRITKKSIKMFFEEKGKHASERVLDKMKIEL
ncbi:MAG: hypothetical protein K5660_05870 [Paludibacteraceae bacterium]|nr:hypothetical protein [Paludibacteraceae bacterium]